MHRHPFARAMSPTIHPYTQESSKSRRNLLEGPSSGGIPPSTRHPPTSKMPTRRPGTGNSNVSCKQVQHRPSHRIILQDGGVSLTLGGQEANASVPVFGRAGTVDGTVSFDNPSCITKVEVKLEGHVTTQELAGGGTAITPVLSELLVFWDAPNRLGGYSSDAEKATGSFAPLIGHCPQSFSFMTALPTHFKEADGESVPLPPSFSEGLSGVPGFRCDVSYAIGIYVTRVKDMRVKSFRAQWKRNLVFRTPVEYLPRTRPSQSAPFPSNSKASSSSPVTRFSFSIDSHSPYVEPIKTTLYLPNSQITTLGAPIPFFLRVSGPDDIVNAYSRPPLSSFLPKAGPDNITTICGLLQHHINEHLQTAKLSRVFSLPNSSSGSFSRISSRASSDGTYQDEKSGAPLSNGIRVVLARQVSVDVAGKDPSYDFSEQESTMDWEKENYVPSSQIHKTTILGEGVMYTSSIARGSVTWAGEIRIDPRFRVRTGGFSTRNLIVRDMVIVSVRDPSPDASPRRKYQQIIPITLTTDTFEQEF